MPKHVQQQQNNNNNKKTVMGYHVVLATLLLAYGHTCCWFMTYDASFSAYFFQSYIYHKNYFLFMAYKPIYFSVYGMSGNIIR